MIDVAALRATLERFARGREGTVDPVGVAHAARLVAAAEAIPEVARERLLARAKETVDRLVARVASAQTSAGRRIDTLQGAGYDVRGLRERLAHGETLAIERTFRRAATLGRDPRRRNPAIEARLAKLAQLAGIAHDNVTSGGLFDVADQLYRRAAATTSATLVLDRVSSERTVDAGRYHTASVSAAVLLAMRDASPAYLRAQLARLEFSAQIQRFLRAFEVIAIPEPKGKGRVRPRAATPKPTAGAAPKAASRAAPKPASRARPKPASRAKPKATPGGTKR